MRIEQEHKGVSKSQYIGLAVLAVLSLAAMVFVHIVDERKARSVSQPTFLGDSISYAEKEPVTAASARPTIFPFDPNTADSLTLVNAGIPPYMVRSMLRYRAKGGRYRYVADMARIPGMSDSLYFALKPYVQIDTERLERERKAAWQRDSLHRDSLYRVEIQREKDSQIPDTTTRYRSSKRDTILDLNSADTAKLQYIRGIGAYRAKMIVRYRSRLGGYVDVHQLRDAEMEMKGPELSDSILRCFYVTPDSVHRIFVNRWGAERMSKHPYLSYTQAKAIYELRRRKVYLDSAEPILDAEILTPEQIQRLEPYLDFAH